MSLPSVVLSSGITQSYSVGSFGARVDLMISQGDTFGPITATVRNPNGTLFDFTGCTITAHLRKTPSAIDFVTFSVTFIDLGKFTFGLSAVQTAAITAGDDPSMASSKYVWDMKLLDSASRKTPLFYGDVVVMRRVTT